MTLSYNLLKNDLEKAVESVVEFIGIEMSEELRKQVKQQVQAQNSFKPGHQNLSLEDFGLSREKVSKDLSFIFDKYGESSAV